MKNYLMFSSRAAIAAIAAAGLCLVSAAQATDETKSDSDTNKTSSTLSAKDKMFVKHAAKGGMKEVQMGEMGEKQAKSDDVKKIAERIESDHKVANEELKDLAEKKGVTLPTEAKMSKKMEKISGDNFDKEYLMAMKADHEKDIAAFEKEANASGSAEDADVKAWAEKTLPTLKEHLSMINDALAKMK